MKRSAKPRLTTPARYYWWTLVLGAGLYAAGKYGAFEFCKDLGCGVLASLIVALLIDIGNTKRQRKKDEEVFRIILRGLREECSALPFHVTFFSSDVAWAELLEKDTWKTRLEYLLQARNLEEDSQLGVCQADANKTLWRIYHLAYDAYKGFDAYAGQGSYSEERRKTLGEISMCAWKLATAIDSQSKKKVQKVPADTDELVNTIISLFPDLKEKLEEKDLAAAPPQPAEPAEPPYEMRRLEDMGMW